MSNKYTVLFLVFGAFIVYQLLAFQIKATDKAEEICRAHGLHSTQYYAKTGRVFSNTRICVDEKTRLLYWYDDN